MICESSYAGHLLKKNSLSSIASLSSAATRACSAGWILTLVGRTNSLPARIGADIFMGEGGVGKRVFDGGVLFDIKSGGILDSGAEGTKALEISGLRLDFGLDFGESMTNIIDICPFSGLALISPSTYLFFCESSIPESISGLEPSS